MLARMTITFAIADSSEEADLLLDPEDRRQLIERLRERQLETLADRVIEEEATTIRVERQWCARLDSLAADWLNDQPPDYLRDGLARLQAVLTLVQS
jgi:hypothetical protein